MKTNCFYLANLSEDKVPSNFEEINIEIKEGVDYIVDYSENRNYSLPSRVIKFSNDGNFEKNKMKINNKEMVNLLNRYIHVCFKCIRRIKSGDIHC